MRKIQIKNCGWNFCKLLLQAVQNFQSQYFLQDFVSTLLLEKILAA